MRCWPGHKKINLKNNGWHNVIPLTERPQAFVQPELGWKAWIPPLNSSWPWSCNSQSLGLIKFLTGSLGWLLPQRGGWEWKKHGSWHRETCKSVWFLPSFQDCPQCVGAVKVSKMAPIAFGFSLEVMKTAKTTLAPESQCTYMVWKVLFRLFMDF